MMNLFLLLLQFKASDTTAYLTTTIDNATSSYASSSTSTITISNTVIESHATREADEEI